MRTIYIGGGAKNTNKGGLKWKLYLVMFVFLAITCSILKIAAPTLVEKWINQNGKGKYGYAFSIRDAGLALSKGEVILNDVKVFHPKTKTELLESPKLTIHVNWTELLQSREKKITVVADQIDLLLSKDLTSEMERIKLMDTKKDFYLNLIEGKIGKLNIIEQKEDVSRTVLELNNVDIKLKEFSLLSINKKTEFNILSDIAEGGKFNLSGKTIPENGKTPWSIQGSLKQVPPELFNKIAGNKLPFAFRESKLDAEIKAHSESGKISGEITPEIKILNLVDEKPGIPTQSIARALTDELTFSLPFSMQDAVLVEYSGTFAKLKNYRKYANSSGSAEPAEVPAPEAAKSKKTSLWPF